MTARPNALAPRLVALGITLAALGTAGRAEAKGPYFLFELNTGLAESAYDAGPAGVAYGASLGTTFKLTSFPVRWAVLATVTGRNGTVDGYHEGLAYSASRRDLDLYLAGRTIVPLGGMFRGYFEVGGGTRWQSQVLTRGSELGALTSRSTEPLVVLALGLDARLNETFSVGLRGELDPVRPDPDLSEVAAGLATTSNRTSLMLQLGLHF